MADLTSLASATMENAPVRETGRAALKRIAAKGDDLSSMSAVRTIAEVAIPGFTSEDEEQVLRALDLAIEEVRFVQRVVAVATQRPVELMSRAMLPPMVPTFRGGLRFPNVNEPHPTPRVHGSITYRIPGCAPPSALGIRPATFDNETLSRVAEVASRLAKRSPFNTFVDLRREAMVERDIRGNNRLALVALAAAGEVLLDTALLHMLWEEHTPPATAAGSFDRNEGHTARVARNFPQRLGGGWDTGSRTPAGEYLRSLVRLRHRVLHAGHEPTADELETGWSALFELERYLGDRLAAGQSLKRYTRTAVAWMAEAGLRRRSRWTRHVEQLVHDSDEPNWVEAFGRWRIHVDRALAGAPHLPGASTDELMLYAEALDDGTIRWIVHDITTVHAALVDPRKVRTADGMATMAAALEHRRSGDLAQRRIGSLLDRPVPDSLLWQPDHELFPELAIFPATATAPPQPQKTRS